MRVTLSVAAVVATALAVAQPALPAPFRSHAAMSAATTTMPSSVERKRRPKALLRNLKACGRALYSASAHQCLHDERKRALLSNVAYCTVDVYAFATVGVGIKMTYGGQTLFTRKTRAPRGHVLHLTVYYELPILLPSGKYVCTISTAGKSVKATITGGGSAGPVANSSVCSSSRAVGDLCASDESTVPIAPTTSLTCSGFFAGQKGHFGGIELLYNQNGVWTSLSKIEGSVSRPILPVSLVVPSVLGQPYTPGQYMCRFTVDGQLVSEKVFSVRA